MDPNLISKIIYLDHHATTPVDPRVLDVMLPYFTEIYGNAASIDHEYGYLAKRAVDKAREQVANVINAQPEEIIFTSGATESDNLAIIGTAQKQIKKGKHIVTCVTEHKAVLDTCQYLEKSGWQIIYLAVDQYGMVNPDDVRKAIRPDTVLITIMTANNEIGTIQPIAEIGKIAKEYGILFHTDAAQAAGHINMNVQSMNIDLMSISGHKIYGPKGIGALYVRKSRPNARISLQMHGGGHERNMRSGTLNVPGIVGLGKALDIAEREMAEETQRLQQLRDQLWVGLKDRILGVEQNGHPSSRLPHNLNIAIPSVESRSLVLWLKDIVAISTGSACTTATVEPSHVIKALGFGEERAHQSIRFGLGRFITSIDIEIATEAFCESVHKVRGII